LRDNLHLAHLSGGQGVAGSNPAVPTNHLPHCFQSYRRSRFGSVRPSVGQRPLGGSSIGDGHFPSTDPSPAVRGADGPKRERPGLREGWAPISA